MRILPLVFIVICGAAAAGGMVTIETRADGGIVRYDPSTKSTEGGMSAIWYEIEWTAPRDCTQTACAKFSRTQMVFNCAAAEYGRVKSVNLDKSGHEIERFEPKPRMFHVADTDVTAKVLFRAACARKADRRAG